MPNIAFVNGQWMPLSDAKVSVEDRGFQFGDGIYELIRTYHKRAFHLHEHLARLQESAKKIEIPLHYSSHDLEKIIQTGCRKGGYLDTKIYIQATRGVAPRIHSFPKKTKPTFVITFREFKPLSGKIRENGIAAVSLPDIRWGKCDAKSLNLLPNCMAREFALRSGAFEAIFVRDGIAYEGAGSNIFAIFGDRIVTPPPGPYILSGITREIVLQIVKKKGLNIRERNIRLKELYAADEIFLTGTTFEILPVISLDGKPISTSTVGEVTASLYTAFREQIGL